MNLIENRQYFHISHLADISVHPKKGSSAFRKISVRMKFLKICRTRDTIALNDIHA